MKAFRLTFALVFTLIGLCPMALPLVGQDATPPPSPAPEAAAPTPAPAEESAKPWLQVDIGIIGTASADILEKALAEVEARNYGGLLIRLDTPGGALEATRIMVKAMMAANFPVVVWVGPSGSRAGSAGAFITLAAHIAAMSPGSNIGAAHPIEATGQDVPGEAGKKVTNDTIAFMESIAKSRNRNVDMARSFVATSVSITAEEAFDNNVINVVASDPDSLMKKIHGREVELQSGSKTKLVTAGARLVKMEKTFRQKMLEILSNPNLFYLLFLAGVIGLGYELTHPGVLFPGVAGAICLILAFIATSVLPISYGAAALLLVGIAMMVAEVFMPSFGVLGVGGLVAFVLGSIFLVDPANEQGLRISWFAILPGTVAIGATIMIIGWLVLRATRSKPQTGAESLVGKNAEVLADFTGGKGRVRVEGEIWQAHLAAESPEEPKRGESVRIESVNGLELSVRKSI